MPLLTCPKCSSRLRVPDGKANASVRCPKCQTVFGSPVAEKPAFEVVEEEPPRPPIRSEPTPTRQPARDIPDLPQAASRKLADGDSREHRRQHVEDETPARVSKRGAVSPRDDDEFDEADFYERQTRSNPLMPAKVATLLLSIGIWLYIAGLGILALFLIIAWGGAKLTHELYILPGLVGLFHWLVMLTGIGFLIGSPSRMGVRGLGIAAAVVAGVHLVLMLVSAFQGPGFGSIGSQVVYSESRGSFDGRVSPPFDWKALAGYWPAVDDIVSKIAYNSDSLGRYVLPFMTGLAELAVTILVLLAVKGMCRSVKAHRTAEQLQMGVLIVCAGTGTLVLVDTLFVVIVREGGFKDFRTIMNLAIGMGLLVILSHVCLLIQPGVAMNAARAAISRRVRDSAR